MQTGAIYDWFKWLLHSHWTRPCWFCRPACYKAEQASNEDEESKLPSSLSITAIAMLRSVATLEKPWTYILPTSGLFWT
jgi:hypothetical protein